VELIKPAVSKVQGQSGEIYEIVTRANVTAGVEKLKNLQPILAPRVQSGSVKVVGGVYDLQTGVVKLLEPESK
jgi:carbonic anhydrase